MNRDAKYFLCLIDVIIKYTCVKPLKDKKAKTVLNGFIGIAIESKCKPSKLWVEQRK